MFSAWIVIAINITLLPMTWFKAEWKKAQGSIYKFSNVWFGIYETNGLTMYAVDLQM